MREASRLLLAVDPGKTTGWAMLEIDTLELLVGELDGLHSARTFFRSMPPPLELIVEDFTISARTVRTKLDYSALRLIGWLELEAYDQTNFHLQSPAKKAFGTDNLLRSIGWHSPSTGGHQNDAVRHLLHFIVTKAPYKTELAQQLLYRRDWGYE